MCQSSIQPTLLSGVIIAETAQDALSDIQQFDAWQKSSAYFKLETKAGIVKNILLYEWVMDLVNATC